MLSDYFLIYKENDIMRQKYFLKLIFITLLSIIFIASFVSCGDGNSGGEHTHSFSMWTVSSAPSCTTPGNQSRTCSACGFSEYSQIPATGHTEVVDLEVAPTCLTAGKTAGSHCSTCNAVIVAQSTIASTGHTPVVDAAVAPTCTKDGKTEGKHCSTCNETLVSQNVVSATGHRFGEGEIITAATCVSEGTKKYTCSVSSCNYSYEDSYPLPSFTAMEIYNQSVQYVGEIVTYDRSGNEYALGTGFVISADGKIVTNYHVLEGAYSATVWINGTTYNITSVLAYDKDIDLAVVKIKANDLPFATVCKNPVNVGETVYAIGSSRGMTNTYSQGIITYADRIVDGISHVQHDASITHGNSGGPLINVYGEVIGINTWGISDSQNLNFAIFADELDNLSYGKALIIAEFYLKECSVFERLKNYIISQGTYSASGNCYKVFLGTSYSSDYSDKYDRLAYYYVNDNTITLDFTIDDGDCWVYFVIDENVDGSYYWEYFDIQDCEMSGTLYATTYSSSSLLGYSYNNISSSSLRNTVRELASSMISYLCARIDGDLAHLGITAEDLLFYNY